MKRIKAVVFVPNGPYCNLQNPTKPWIATDNVCRFYSKSGTCLLYNFPISKIGQLIEKCNKCLKVSCGFDDEEESVDISDLATKTFMELAATYATAIKSGKTDKQAINIALRQIGVR